MKIKKILAALLVILTVFSIAACSSSSKNLDEMSVADIMLEITDGLEAPGSAMVAELDSESFEYFAFTQYEEGFEAAAWEAQMSSVAHSVVLIRVNDNSDVNAIAADIELNADPRKWICVEAETTKVLTKDNLILLVMTNSTTADEVIKNFNNL